MVEQREVEAVVERARRATPEQRSAFIRDLQKAIDTDAALPNRARNGIISRETLNAMLTALEAI